MNERCRKSGLRAVCLSAILAVSLSGSLEAKNEPKSEPSKNLMPAGHGSFLQAVPVPEAALNKALKLNIRKDGTSYYADGRVAVVRDKAARTASVYTYQDDIGGTTVFHLDHKQRVYSIDQYVGGKLFSSMGSGGEYLTFYNTDGTVHQRIDPVTLQVYTYNYNDHVEFVLDENGVFQPVRVIDEKTTFLSTPEGNMPYSTTTYSKEDGVVVEMTTYAESLKKETVKDGKLLQSVDENGLVTDYRYVYDKKGKLIKRIGTREDGLETVLDYRKQKKAPRVNFGKVLNAVLKSLKYPDLAVSVKTSSGITYTFRNGTLVKTEHKSSQATHYFSTGLVLESVSQGGRTVIRNSDDGYVRL